MKYCSKCGVQNAEAAKFCVGCGKSFTQNVPPPVATQAPQPMLRETGKKKNALPWIVAITAVLGCGILLYFLLNKKEGTPKLTENAKTSTADGNTTPATNTTQPATTSDAVPFTNGNPTMLNGEDVYKGYETGRFPVYIKTMYKHNGKYYMDVDLVQVFTGDAVEKAMKQDKVYYDENIDEIYVRNQYNTLRTYEIAPNCRMFPKRTEAEMNNKNGFNFMEYINKELGSRLFYIYLTSRVCYKMEEQYFP